MLEIKESNGQFLIVEKSNGMNNLKAVAYDKETANKLLQADNNAMVLAQVRRVLSALTNNPGGNNHEKITDPTSDARNLLAGIDGNGHYV